MKKSIIIIALSVCIILICGVNIFKNLIEADVDPQVLLKNELIKQVIDIHSFIRVKLNHDYYRYENKEVVCYEKKGRYVTVPFCFKKENETPDIENEKNIIEIKEWRM